MKKIGSLKFLTCCMLWVVLKDWTKMMLKNDCRVMHVKWASIMWKTWTLVYAAKQKCEEEGEKDKSEIGTTLMSLNSAQIQVNITDFLQINITCVEKCTLWSSVTEPSRIFGLSMFFDYSCILSLSVAWMTGVIVSWNPYSWWEYEGSSPSMPSASSALLSLLLFVVVSALQQVVQDRWAASVLSCKISLLISFWVVKQRMWQERSHA
jgi:hypothetical protein